MFDNSSSSAFVAAALGDYLAMWTESNWIDSEKIHFLGRDMASICPQKEREALISAVASKASKSVALTFKFGFDSIEQRFSKSNGPPALAELNKLLASLEAELPDRFEQDVQTIFGKYLAYTEHGGDQALLINCVLKICTLLVKVKGRKRVSAANLSRKIIQNCLKWAPGNNRLWGLWGRSLAKSGAFNAAELIYWEALRRFPQNMFLQEQLIEVVKAQRRRDDALKISREGFSQFPKSKNIAIQYSLLLAKTRIASNVSDAIRILTESLKSGDNYPALTALASVLVTAENIIPPIALDLDALVDRLKTKKEAIGALISILQSDHPTSNIAETLARAIATPDNQIGQSQLAGVLANSGDATKVSEAITMLRTAISGSQDTLSLSNHLANILGSSGIIGDRNEAIRILRDNSKTYPENSYAATGLAKILASSGDISEREEAIEILSKLKEEYAKHLLHQIRVTPIGRPAHFAKIERNSYKKNYSEDNLDDIMDSGVSVSSLLPRDVQDFGNLRYLRFKADNGSESEKAAAFEEIKKYLEEGPSFIYAKLLAIRQGLWKDEANDIPNFALAFEQAMHEKDSLALEAISLRFPKFTGLTIVARSMFGDEQASAKLQNIFDLNDTLLHPAALVLKRLIRPHLALISGGHNAVDVIGSNIEEIKRALYDANEFTLISMSEAA
jgi:tetratricopeptide (TPR) repeat protein